MRVAVVVPTYRRPESLARCLEGIARQQDPPDEVVVVRRREDEASADVAAPVRSVIVNAPGVVAAMQAGARATASDVIAFCDDDAIPRPDWSERIRAAFVADTELGAFGGRDLLGPPTPSIRRNSTSVGSAVGAGSAATTTAAQGHRARSTSLRQ